MNSDTLLFTGGIVAIATTSFGFISSAFLVTRVGRMFNLAETQLGALQGVGLYPFALANGVVEGATNAVVASRYPRSKTHHLNILVGRSRWEGLCP